MRPLLLSLASLTQKNLQLFSFVRIFIDHKSRSIISNDCVGV